MPVRSQSSPESHTMQANHFRAISKMSDLTRVRKMYLPFATRCTNDWRSKWNLCGRRNFSSAVLLLLRSLKRSYSYQHLLLLVPVKSRCLCRFQELQPCSQLSVGLSHAISYCFSPLSSKLLPKSARPTSYTIVNQFCNIFYILYGDQNIGMIYTPIFRPILMLFSIVYLKH